MTVVRLKKMLPRGIVPGLHMAMGHHRVGAGPNADGKDYSNEDRRVNLFKPAGVKLAPARHVSYDEWVSGRC